MLGPATKFSAARRWGDAYEQRLLELQALRLLTDEDVVAVYHEHREAAPVDDIIVERRSLLEAFQAKHSADPHGVYTYEQLLGTSPSPRESIVSIRDLFDGWRRLRSRRTDIIVHVYTNRSADTDLARILNNDRVALGVIEGQKGHKRRRAKLAAACGSPDDPEFALFLESLRFNLRRPSSDGLRGQLVADLDSKLGISDPSVVNRYVQFIERRFHERASTPITRQELLRALQLDRSTLPQVFPVDRRTHINRGGLLESLHDRIEAEGARLLAVVGPPGSGKSTLLSRLGDELDGYGRFTVLRYYAYVSMLDPEQSRRAGVESFVRGLSEQVWTKYGDLIQTGRRYDYSVERLGQLLCELSDALTAAGRKLLIIVDGLDHAERAQLPGQDKFTSFLSRVLPLTAVSVLGTQDTSFLAPYLQEQLRDGIVRIPPFSEQESSRCFERASGVALGGPENRALLQRITEGLPLYVHYAAEYVRNHEPCELRTLLHALPPYSGDITSYYSWLWSHSSTDQITKRACALLARLSFTLPESDFCALLNADAFASEAVLQRVRHLLSGGNAAMRIFHNSFRLFVEARLSEEQIRSVDDQILQHLDKHRWTKDWFAHAMGYAVSAHRDDLIREYVARQYVEQAITSGRPLEETQASLLLAFDRSVIVNDVVLAADCARCMTDASVRLEYEIDVAELDACIEAAGEGETEAERVLAAVARGEVPLASWSTLATLARSGHLESCRTVALNTIQAAIRGSQSTSRDDLSECVRIGCIYDVVSPIWVLNIVDANLGNTQPRGDPGRELLRVAIRGWASFGHSASLRVLRRLLERTDPAGEIRAYWTLEMASVQADLNLPGATWAVREAVGAARESCDRLMVGALVARFDLGRAAAATLLGNLVYPNLEEQVFYGMTREAFAHFRDYVRILVYLERGDELKAVASRLSLTPGWLSFYYKLNMDLMLLATRYPAPCETPERSGLALLARLSEQPRGDEARIFEKFSEIRADLATWLSGLLQFLLHHQVSAERVSVALEVFSRSDIANTHYGIGDVVVDYRLELLLLEVMGRFPGLRSAMEPTFDRLRDKIAKETQETATRTSHFLRLGTVAGRCGWKKVARDCLRDAVLSSGGYGHRKDGTLDLLIDASEFAAKHSFFDEKGWAQMASCAAAMEAVTDGKGTQHFAQALFRRVVESRPTRALPFLRLLEGTVGAWKVDDCISIYLHELDAWDPLVAYVLTHLMDDCADIDGFEPKARTLLRVLGSMVQGGSPHSIPLAADVERFLRCEVDPKTTAQFAPDFNDIARRLGVAAIPASVSPVVNPGTADRSVGDDRLLTGSDGKPIRPEDVERLIGDSVDAFGAFVARARRTGVDFAYQESIGAAARHLLSMATVRADVDRIVDVEFIGVAREAESYAAIASAYQSVGEAELCLNYFERAFETAYGWGIWDKNIQYLDASHRSDRSRPLLVALASVRRHLTQYGRAHGADLLLMRCLDRFEADRHSVLQRIYDGLRTHVLARFSHLELDLPSYESAFRDHFEESFWSVGLDMIRTRWTEIRELRRRRSLLRRMIVVGGIDPATWVPFVVSVACGDSPQWVKTEALYVLTAWRTCGVFDASSAPCLRALMDRWTHFEGRELIDELLPERAIPRNDRISGRVSLPPGIRPSREFMRDIRDQSLVRVTDIVPHLAACLSIGGDELLWRVERYLEIQGISVGTLREEDEALRRSSIHPQGMNYAWIPFEPASSAAFREGLNAVAEELCPNNRRQEVMRLLRSRDWWTSWCPATRPPGDLRALDLSGPESRASEAAWCELRAVPDALIVRRKPEWTPVFDRCFISSTKGAGYDVGRFAALAASDRVENASQDDLARIVHRNLLRIGTLEEGSYSAEEVRVIAEAIPPAVELKGAAEVPLLALHRGSLALLDENAIAVVPGFWMRQLGLEWRSDGSFTMVRNGTPLTRTRYWEGGRAVGLYEEQSLGSGVRTSIHRTLADELRVRYGLNIIVYTWVRRALRRQETSDRTTKGELVFRVDVL
ncbi:MAG: ATP-binding protein [Deltaproteobacteria bacterium]|jgi:hypothetical protein